MARALKGSRSSKEASIVLSSMSVTARKLDAAGTPVGDEITLGTVTIDTASGVVSLEDPVNGASPADGWQILVREFGRDSQTTATRVFFEPETVDPDPTPDTTKPSTPVVHATEITPTSFKLDWSSTDDVAVVKYEFKIDDDPVTPTTGTTVTVTRSATPGATYAVRVVAFDAAGNESDPATLTVTTLTPKPEPPASTWPDATSTGRRSTAPLTKRSGYTVRTAGTVIEDQEISGTLIIDAANVVVRNCVVRASFFGIETTRNGRGLIVEDCTIIGGGDCGIAVTQSSDATVRRCNISGGFDGMKVGGANVTVERNYIHDLASSRDAHNDGIQCMGGVTNLRVLGNYIAARDTSCLAMFENQGTWNGATIDGNWMGGAGYLIYAGGNDGTNIKIRNNTFGSYGYSHPVTDWSPKSGHEWSGNKMANGVAVSQP